MDVGRNGVGVVCMVVCLSASTAVSVTDVHFNCVT